MLINQIKIVQSAITESETPAPLKTIKATAARIAASTTLNMGIEAVIKK